MANDKGQTTGSVLFSSLAKGLQGLQQGMEQKRQNDLQNLMMAMKVQDAEMNREAFLQSQQLREQQIQNAQQSFKKGQLELNRLADPVGTARREAEAKAEQQAVFNQRARDEFIQSMNTPIPLIGQEAMNFAQGAYLNKLENSPLPFQTSFDPLTGLPNKLEVSSPKQFAPDTSKSADELFIENFGTQAWRNWKEKGKVPIKALSADDQIIYNFYKKEYGDDNGIKKFVEYKTQSKTNTPQGAALRLLQTLSSGGRKATFRLDDPDEKQALSEVIKEFTKSVYGEEVDIFNLNDTLGVEDAER